jgi:hypothetical protein
MPMCHKIKICGRTIHNTFFRGLDKYVSIKLTECTIININMLDDQFKFVTRKVTTKDCQLKNNDYLLKHFTNVKK